jgi:hypothetical protein
MLRRTGDRRPLSELTVPVHPHEGVVYRIQWGLSFNCRLRTGMDVRIATQLLGQNLLLFDLRSWKRHQDAKIRKCRGSSGQERDWRFPPPRASFMYTLNHMSIPLLIREPKCNVGQDESQQRQRHRYR